MTLGFDFHPEARGELMADVDWYDDREVGVGERFEAAVRAAIGGAVDSPESWAIWPGWDRQPVVRSKGVSEPGGDCSRWEGREQERWTRTVRPFLAGPPPR